ncbi:hypothetical protein QYS62_001875 [Fusarium acuminatum]|uniref:Uncharacterized protein n=1 Tax=Fusarium acuminatum TaxID=5515 RepID=A0ABZ2WJS9_9HYPO
MAPSLRDQQDNESVSSVNRFDPEPTVVQKTITRQEAIDQAGDLIHKIRYLDFQQVALRSRIAAWISEPVLRVLPPRLKANLHVWCWLHDRKLFYKLSKFLDEDLSEWDYTVEISNRQRDMACCDLDTDILRFYVANLKPLRKGLPEQQRRELVNKLRNGLALFADYHDEKIRTIETATQALLQQEQNSINTERNAFLAASELQSQAMLD